MKTITILSGKGGVGKSSITASLAIALSKQRKIVCADCDVDASNLALVFGIKDSDYAEWASLTTNQKAEFDLERCNSCRRCVDTCYFKAIRWEDNKPRLKEFGCEGCGACELVCPQKAIELVDVNNAKIGYSDSKRGFNIVSAQLDVGASGSGKIVFEVKQKAKELAKDAEIMLVDSAAGIGCPVIASVTGSDYAIIVTEPTPSGFSDFKRALEVINHFNIPYGAIINKFNINEIYAQKIEDFVKENNGSILMKLPYDRIFVEALVNMKPIAESSRKYSGLFAELAENVIKQL
ncbi:P-loop NTPase [Candidatus Woesearchaeota archaeon]|nr:P-loop NTPase [Candidatus Woesearchaeota archaeon]